MKTLIIGAVGLPTEVDEGTVGQTIRWLAGLLSTDGCVHQRGKTACRYWVSTTELDWAEMIKARLEEIGLTVHIRIAHDGFVGYAKSKFRTFAQYHMVEILDPYLVTGLLRKYGAGFMSPRKWAKIQDRYIGFKPKRNYSKRECRWMSHNAQLSIQEMADSMNRSYGSVKEQRHKLGIFTRTRTAKGVV